MLEKINEKSRPIVIFAFIIMLLLGLWVTPNYGMPWDELLEIRTLGSNVREYIGLFAGEENRPVRSTTGIAFTDYTENPDMDHGQSAFYPFAPLLFANLGSEGPRTLMILYHGYNFLLFMAGVICLYFIGKHLTKDWKYGLAASLFMYLSPRMFAEGHINSKDMVAMSLVIVCFWFGIKMIETKKFGYAVVLALMAAVATNMRITSMLIFLLIGLVYILYLSTKKLWSKRNFWVGMTSVLSFLGFSYILTPAAWRTPLEYIGYVIDRSSNYEDWPGMVFFQGVSYRPVPWYYIPVMIGVTTPILFLVLSLIGHFSAIKAAIGKKFKGMLEDETKYYVICIIFTWAFLLFAMIMRPIFYNSWRHLFFIYGPILILAIGGLKYIIDKLSGKLKQAAVGVIIAQLIVLAIIIGVNHPHEHVYFNVLAGSDPAQNYEYDYWNVSQMQLLMDLVDHPDTPYYMVVYADDWYTEHGLLQNHAVLPQEYKNAILILPYQGSGIPDNADYLMTNRVMTQLASAEDGNWAAYWLGVSGGYNYFYAFEPVVSFEAFGSDYMTIYEIPRTDD